MGSKAKPGFKSFVQVSTDGGTTYADVSEQKTGTLRVSNNKIEVTNKNTSPNAEGMINLERIIVSVDWSASVSSNQIDDTLQVALQTAAVAGTSLYWRFITVKGVGLPMITGPGTVEFDTNAPLTDASMINFSVTATGALVFGTQS